MIIWGAEKRMKTIIQDIFDLHFSGVAMRLGDIVGVVDLSNTVKELTQQLTKLKIEKSKIEEEFARKEREIEHKLGLERKRQEQDLAIGLREQKVKLQEENLSRDKQRFEDQMKFHNDRFTEETKYLKTIITDLAERLPSMKIEQKISTKE